MKSPIERMPGSNKITGRNATNSLQQKTPLDKLVETAAADSHMAQLLLESKKNGKQISIFDVLNASKLDKHNTNVNKPRIGDMVVFNYSPKGHETLPYWDRFPLIFIVDVLEDRFHGINLHYLPPQLRIKLIANLKTLNTDNNYDDRTRVRMNYKILKQSVKFREFAPCYKEYVFHGLKSRFVKIHSSEWDIASLLPMAQFARRPPQQVFRESVQKIRRFKSGR